MTRSKEQRMAFYESCKSQGICTKCREPNDTNVFQCSVCTAAQVERKRQLKLARLQSAACIDCRKENDQVNTRQYCTECAAVRRAIRAKVCSRKKSSGICLDCSQEALETTLYCRDCVEQRKLSAKKQYTNKKTLGICVYCNKVEASSGLLCKPCRKKSSEKNLHYVNRRYTEDQTFRLSCILRARARMAVKQNTKAGSAVRNLGCSLDDFVAYLESKFQPGMAWHNYGVKGWHMDHIVPLASFDLSDPHEFTKAAHYTNYQPLWAKDNFSKADHPPKNRAWIDSEIGWVNSESD